MHLVSFSQNHRPRCVSESSRTEKNRDECATENNCFIDCQRLPAYASLRCILDLTVTRRVSTSSASMERNNVSSIVIKHTSSSNEHISPFTKAAEALARNFFLFNWLHAKLHLDPSTITNDERSGKTMDLNPHKRGTRLPRTLDSWHIRCSYLKILCLHNKWTNQLERFVLKNKK